MVKHSLIYIGYCNLKKEQYVSINDVNYIVFDHILYIFISLCINTSNVKMASG
jgi:hypothetical protein